MRNGGPGLIPDRGTGTEEAAMRARYPDVEGFIERDGVKVGYEVFGEGEPAVVFVPIDAIVQSRAYKAQVPYLSLIHI